MASYKYNYIILTCDALIANGNVEICDSACAIICVFLLINNIQYFSFFFLFLVWTTPADAHSWFGRPYGKPGEQTADCSRLAHARLAPLLWPQMILKCMG